MIESLKKISKKPTQSLLLISFCILLPNIHVTGLSSQVVIPREFILYLYTSLFLFVLVRRNILQFHNYYAVGMVFLIWHVLALSWSSDLSTGIEDSLNAYAFLICSFALYQYKDHNIRDIILNSLIFSISFSALIGILQNFELNLFNLYQAAPPSSTFNNKNLAASASLLFFPVSLAKLLTSNKQAHKILFSLAAAILLSYILIAHTKGVWLAGLCLIFITIVIYKYLRTETLLRIRHQIASNRLHLIGIFLISLSIFLAPGLRNKGSINIDDYSLSSFSAEVRLGFYLDALPLITQNPIAGVGTGSLRREFRAAPSEDYARQHAESDRYLNRLHNDHLQYLVEQGIVGLSIWLGLLFIVLNSSFHFLRQQHIPLKDKAIAFALALGILGMTIHATVSFPIRSISTGSLYWLLTGILLSFQKDEKKLDTKTISAIVKYPLIFLLLTISVFSVQNIAHRAIGSYYTKQSLNALIKGNCFASKLYLNNLLTTTTLDLKSAQLLATTYDLCGGTSPKDTIALMNHILAFEPNHSLALTVMADNTLQLGQNKSAYELYSRALQVNPKESRAALGIAKTQSPNNQLNITNKHIIKEPNLHSKETP